MNSKFTTQQCSTELFSHIPLSLNASSLIGAAVAAGLTDRGVRLGGCGECAAQCDLARPEDATSWRYDPKKNG